jgi:murein DD-endopeptidase MepM/ murein hydrolase activator NlpD
MFKLILIFFLLISYRDAYGIQWPVDCIPNKSCEWFSFPDIDKDGKPASCGALGTNGFGRTGHIGTDIGASHGTGVLAAESGTVLWVFDNKYDRCTPTSIHPECNLPLSTTCTLPGPYCDSGAKVCSLCFLGGNTIVILHDTDIFGTRYTHLKQHSALVSPGEAVSKGQKIAEVGSSGNSNVPHLHFDVWGATFKDVIDPWSGPCGPSDSLWDLDPLSLGDARALVEDVKAKVPIVRHTKSLRRLLGKIAKKKEKGKSVCTKLSKVTKKVNKLIKKNRMEGSLGRKLIKEVNTIKPYLGC